MFTRRSLRMGRLDPPCRNNHGRREFTSAWRDLAASVKGIELRKASEAQEAGCVETTECTLTEEAGYGSQGQSER